MPKSLAIIPARGGSKRIPRKNIRKFAGRPIMAYSVEAALASGIFDRVMVSTEDQEIKATALELGAEVPFLRSTKNADDFAGLEHIFEEVVQCYHQRGEDFDCVCMILATAPFITPKHLMESARIFIESDAHALLSVCPFSYPIQRALKLESEKLSMFTPEFYDTRSQDLEPAFHDAGQFYWFRVEHLERIMKDIFTGAIAYPLPASEVQDIDTEEDWKIAEFKFTMMSGRTG